MATKKSNPTLDKIGDNEEVFTLRGRDESAPQTVVFWIAANINNPGCPDAKLREALDCALKMRRTAERRAAD